MTSSVGKNRALLSAVPANILEAYERLADTAVHTAGRTILAEPVNHEGVQAAITDAVMVGKWLNELSTPQHPHPEEAVETTITVDAVKSVADFMGVEPADVPTHLIHPVTGVPWNLHTALGIARKAALNETPF